MAKKDWQDDLRGSAHKIWLAGLGAMAVAEEEGSKLFKNLVAQGERFEPHARQALKDAKKGAGQASEKARRMAEETTERARKVAEGAWEQLGGAFDEKLAKALHRIGVPTRDEISALTRRIEELTRAVERVRGSQAKPGAAKPAPRPAAKAASKPAAAKAAAKSAAPKPAAASKPPELRQGAAGDGASTAGVAHKP